VSGNAPIDLKELRWRLDYLSERAAEYENRRRQNSGKLPKSDWWRLAYCKYPYLIGATQDEYNERFCDIFLNTTDLTEKGQISPAVGMEDDSYFMQKFTHLLEENRMYVDTIQRGRAPIVDYFANGTPIGVRLFQGARQPSNPILVKYSKREYLEPMLREGRIRISPAAFYDSDGHIASIRDAETHRPIKIPTFRERLAGKTSVMVKGTTLNFNEKDLEINVEVPNYYMFCTSSWIYYRLPSDFNSDAALIIFDPDRFVRTVVSKFLAIEPLWKPVHGNIRYYDPYLETADLKVPEMSKHIRYAYQREHRIAFIRGDYAQREMGHIHLTIGDMRDYATLVTLPEEIIATA